MNAFRTTAIAAAGVAILASGCGGDTKSKAAVKAPKKLPPLSLSDDKPEQLPATFEKFLSAPGIKPPVVAVQKTSPKVAPGYVFIAPKKGPGQAGLEIVDNSGEVVWFKPLPEGIFAYDFRAQRYRGKPVLTWWEGKSSGGHGEGEAVIMDSRYREIARVRAGNGYAADMHDFTVTADDTALIGVYKDELADVSAIGGSGRARVWENIFQEIDIKTGKVLFEFKSLDEIDVGETIGEYDPKTKKVFDYMHLNSIDKFPNGDYLISARLTSALYRISHRTGKVVWRLGGTKSDFKLSERAKPVLQHDARLQPDGTITTFDNGEKGVSKHSRLLYYELDTKNMRAKIVRSVHHPKDVLGATQGNTQALPNGNVFGGFGSQGVQSEFDRSGELIFNATVPGAYDSYRSFRFEWTGRPASPPAIVAEPAGAGIDAWVSWNGATDVHRWQLLAGASADDLSPVGEAKRAKGFETRLSAPAAAAYVAAEALDSNGRSLGRSEPAKL